jgi:hypothetical protein
MADTKEAQKIPLSSIVLDDRLQGREVIDEAVVDEYADIIKANGQFEGRRPRVFEVPGMGQYLAGGWHRYYAHKRAGKKSMEVDITEGTFHEAFVYACGDNSTHGLNRTVADKRRIVALALSEPLTMNWTARAIADLCKVSRALVKEIMEQAEEKPAKRIGKDGREHPTQRRQVAERPPDSSPIHESAQPQVAERPPAETTAEPFAAPESDFEVDDSPAPTKPRIAVCRDAKDREVPESLRTVFEAESKFRGAASSINQIVAALMEMRDAHPAGVYLGPSVEIESKNLTNAFMACRPFVVCPACSGTTLEGGLENAPICKVCRANGKPVGWLSRGGYDRLPDTLKAVADAYQEFREE